MRNVLCSFGHPVATVPSYDARSYTPVPHAAEKIRSVSQFSREFETLVYVEVAPSIHHEGGRLHLASGRPTLQASVHRTVLVKLGLFCRKIAENRDQGNSTSTQPTNVILALDEVTRIQFYIAPCISR